MTITTRRIIAVCTALITVAAAFVWASAGEDLVAQLTYFGRRHVPLSQAGAPRPDAFDRSAHLYYELLIDALILAIGGLAALLVLVPRPSFRQRSWIYVGFLLITLPASNYNYELGDTVLAPTYQFALNFITIFLTATVAIWVGNLPTKSADPQDDVCLLAMGSLPYSSFF